MEAGRELAARREASDHDAVVILDLGGDALPAELRCPLAASGAHRGPQVVVAEKARDRSGDRLRLARWHEEALAAAPDDALVAMDVRGDDRGARRHRLEQDDPERLAAGRGADVDVGRP